jgi:hypothetical protein
MCKDTNNFLIRKKTRNKVSCMVEIITSCSENGMKKGNLRNEIAF